VQVAGTEGIRVRTKEELMEEKADALEDVNVSYRAMKGLWRVEEQPVVVFLRCRRKRAVFVQCKDIVLLAAFWTIRTVARAARIAQKSSHIVCVAVNLFWLNINDFAEYINKRASIATICFILAIFLLQCRKTSALVHLQRSLPGEASLLTVQAQ
jgi:hypothetical protein